MGLDYWNPLKVVNFRDVSESVEKAGGGRVLPRGRLYRGGTIKHRQVPEAYGNPATIFNLTNDSDHALSDAVMYDFPIFDAEERYNTSDPEVRRWLTDIVRVIEGGIDYPLFVHCNSGKDRTGVVIACLLLILEVHSDVIVREYMSSEGSVHEQTIQKAITGIGSVKFYLRRVDLDVVRKRLRGE